MTLPIDPDAITGEDIGEKRATLAMADRALDASDGRIGGLFPCGVVVRQTEPGTQEVYHVSIMRIARIIGMAPDDEAWTDIVAETGEMVDEAFAALEAE
jgi:uncharacterized protein (DUF302 family)